MANYLLVYTGGDAPGSEAEGAAVMKAWMDWFTRLGEAVVDGGNPTTPVGKAIAPDGSVSIVPAGAMVTGYSILKADSLDAAVELAKGCPQLAANGVVSVYEAFNVM